MKNIVALRTLREYWLKHSEVKQHLLAWYRIAMAATWVSPAEVKQTLASASILKSGRVVFNIKGNEYRLVVDINYKSEWIYVRFIGTHAEYDKIDANTI